MASTSATLSWASTSWLNSHNPTKSTNQTTSAFVVVAQKKARKIRKVPGAAHNPKPVHSHFQLISFIFFCQFSDLISNGFVVRYNQIILKEDVADLGTKGDLLEVKPGYFRNYLLPMGMAQIVTPRLIKYCPNLKTICIWQVDRFLLFLTLWVLLCVLFVLQFRSPSISVIDLRCVVVSVSLSFVA